MIKRIFIILLLSVFILQFVSATNTEIKIKTIANSEVYLTIMDASVDGYSSLKMFNNYSSPYGDIVFNYEGDESVFDLMVVIKKNEERIYYHKFRENYVAGEDISLEIEPEGYHLVETPNVTIETNNTIELNLTNQTISNNTIKDNQSDLLENNSLGITGMAVSDNSNGVSKAVYYIGAFILLLLLAFFGLKFMKSKQPRKIKITKLSEMNKPVEDLPIENIEGDMEMEREKRIKELQEKIAREREELERLSK